MIIGMTFMMRCENRMNKLNVPNSFEERETIEEAVAFCMANGHDEDEAYEMVRQALHNPMSDDIFISSAATTGTRFNWFSL